ncbi:MAG: type 2 isopentenyl-diphosphate Delta-isomerase [Archangiaceae bacterium]|nr:type 2 isopentenyl-diphosphate Delta-isomerase [Archangiaceae bacterium]
MPDDTTTSRRKDAHLDLCATEEVAPRENSTLLECVKLVHSAMPELQVSDIDLSTRLFGKTLKAPLLITGMTGGSERAAQVNRDLAEAAEACGVAFGVGSQRAMGETPALAKTYSVREVAPRTVLIGNIGLRQAAQLGVDKVRAIVDAIHADGLALHLNPGQELTQPEGDRDFRGGYQVVAQLVKAFGERLLVKETGCGIAPDVARRLVDAGVRTLDVSGLGGTSWVRVEQLRASGELAEVGAQFSSWGIPTAAAVATVRRAVGPGVTLIASGGVRTGLDVAKAIALGADLGGMALPMFKAQQTGGVEAVKKAIDVVVRATTQALMLCGASSAAELKKKPRVVVGELKEWLSAV